MPETQFLTLAQDLTKAFSTLASSQTAGLLFF